MVLPSVHPSQRRFACELCRRHKSKCERTHRDDPKCLRCMIVGATCTAGQQKRVGRPKQASASAQDVSKAPAFKSRSTGASRGKALRWQSQESQLPHSLFREGPSVPNSCGQLGSSSAASLALKPAPAPSVVAQNSFIPTMMSNIGMEPVQNSLTWDLSHDHDHESFSDFDSIINFTPTDDHSPDPTATDIYRQESPPGDNSTDAIVKLSKINLDLHVRLAAAEMNRTMLDLNGIVYREGPLFIQNRTLAEFTLTTSDEFVQILTQLCSSQKPVTQPFQSHQGTSTFSLTPPYAAPQPIIAPLALAITSIFTQLISLYEVLLGHLTTRIERLRTEPLLPIPGLRLGGSPLAKPCTQGMLFSDIIVELLEQMESALGLNEMANGVNLGLLSARQIDVLWSELDGRVGITPRDGAMKPTHVKKLFRKVAVILYQFSLAE
ncbi:hypothetical protein BJX99DRAFT_257655 [Aspergillus californicus]